MAHHQRVQVGTETEKDEAILDARVLGIIDQQGMLIRKHCLRLLESDSMFSYVVLILPFIPLKCNAKHIYIICTLYIFVKPRTRISTPASAAVAEGVRQLHRRVRPLTTQSSVLSFSPIESIVE